ncbi:MAG: ribosome small subunit-dependent GTPase A [Bacteroidota bacterium]
MPEVAEGRVIRSVGSSTRVETPEGKRYDCIVRGKFRIKDLNTTNPVAVGDQVRFQVPEEVEQPGVIIELLPRKNYLLRKAISHGRKVHILAANVDQAVLVFTVDHPATSTGFANRFLVVAEGYHIPVTILFNKTDLLTNEAQQAQLQELMDLYEKIGYPVHAVNALDPAYQSKIQDIFKDQLSFIGGHSGAGKSTIINLLAPDLQLKTSDISGSTNKGRHTTTYAEMFALPEGGYLIDSPGIKELGITGFDKSDLSHYFPEMRERMADCKFSNCTHTREPKCAVKAALETGEIHPSRYDSYLRMLEEV